MIPLRTDRPLRTNPWVNFTLITLNVIIFIIENLLSNENQIWIRANFMQWPTASVWGNQSYFIQTQPQLYQFFTSTFLHGDHWHLAGNMLFLWIFGNLVEDKLGHLRYLLFYLTGGIVAGLAHCLFSSNPALGASGAISAVTGAFLVLFPRTKVRVLWLFILISVIEIPSIWFIGIAIARDILMQLQGAGHVAYMAHLGGTAYGLFIALVLLGFHIYPREPYDLVSLIKHWNRRREFRAVTRRGYDAFSGHQPQKKSAFKKPPAKKPPLIPAQEKSISTTARPNKPDAEAVPLDPGQTRQTELRQSIHQAIANSQLTEAAQKFRALIAEAPNTIMGEADQLALANQFFAQKEHVLAERMYRTLLESFPGTDPHGEVRLMLGLTLLRYLNQPDEARPYLEDAVKRLGKGENLELASTLLREINHRAAPLPTPPTPHAENRHTPDFNNDK